MKFWTVITPVMHWDPLEDLGLRLRNPDTQHAFTIIRPTWQATTLWRYVNTAIPRAFVPI